MKPFERIRNTVLAGVTAISLSADKAQPIETELLPVISSPYEASKFLHSYTLEDGDGHESAVMTGVKNGKFFSNSINGESDYISYTNYENLLNQNNPNSWYVFQHNHPHKVIFDNMKYLQIENTSVKNSDYLLSGPSIVDCFIHPVIPGSFGFGSKINTDYIVHNIVVEPGGYWLCKQKDYTQRFEEIGLRRDLIKISLSGDKDALDTYIPFFISKMRRLTGMEIKFLPKDIDEASYNSAIKSFFGIDVDNYK